MIKLQHNHESTSVYDLAPDLTPMLDILFIMLVFFMLTAGSVFQSLDLKLPSSVMEELTILNEPEHIMLEIHQNKYALNNKSIKTFDELRQAIPALLKDKPDYELIIAGDKRIAIERLLKVLTYLQSEGIDAANILMQQETIK
jgi:biopolymer transport protein ExbD